MTPLPLRAAFAALALSLATIAQAAMLPGEPSRAPKQSTPATLLLPAARASAVALPPVTDAELSVLRDANRRGGDAFKPQGEARRVNIGIERGAAGELLQAPAASALAWQPVAGGRAAQLAITSPEAAALRVALDLTDVPLTVELRFAGSATGRVEGPVRVGDIADRTKAWWSPITEGDTITVEIFAPDSVAVGRLGLRATRVSHLLATPSSGFAKRVQDIGLAGSCNVDIQCSTLNGDAAFRNAVESVAQIVFQDGSLTGLCTATLLNDSDTSTQVPYLYTANHCFENDHAPYKTASQMQTVANTLTTLWGFQATTCGSLQPRSDWTQVAGGSTHLYNNPQSDALFLRMAASPPSYAFYAGWETSPISTNTGVVSIHHPQGDLKKVSQGTVRSISTLSNVGPGGGSFIEVLWSTGTTEAGSSGAGIFTPASSVNQYVFRGGLWGGTALCSNRSGTDYFSRFDQVYPSIVSYLGTSAPSSAGPTADFTDLWWAGESENGWGLNLVQHASKTVFGVWYTYDANGQRTWFNFSDGTWTGTNVYQATLYSVSGPPQTGAFDPNAVRRTVVGSVTLTFSDASNGTFRYTVNGISGTKTIARFGF